MSSPWTRLMVVLFLLGCDHSESFSARNYGAVGPLISGDETRLTYGSVTQADWTPDGQGIVVSLSGCIAVLPPRGGSAVWEGCDTRGGLTDSTHHIDSYSVGFGGRVLFSVSVRDKKWDMMFMPPPFPLFAHGDLWLSDTGSFTAAHKVLALYDDVTAPLTAGPSGFVTVANVTWLNDADFLALSSGVTFNGLFGPPQLIRGTVTPSGVTLSAVPGATFASTRALTNVGSTMVVITGALTLGASPVSGGNVSAFASVPDGPNRHIVDVTCQTSRCAILTQEGGAGNTGVISTFWTVPATGGTAQAAKSFPHAINSGNISPVGRDALTFEGGGLYLLTDVVP